MLHQRLARIALWQEDNGPSGGYCTRYVRLICHPMWLDPAATARLEIEVNLVLDLDPLVRAVAAGTASGWGPLGEAAEQVWRAAEDACLRYDERTGVLAHVAAR